MPETTGGRKVAALVTVCASLMVITLDVTILNVALPTLARELEASNSALQWFVNAYELAFAGLLLTAWRAGRPIRPPPPPRRRPHSVRSCLGRIGDGDLVGRVDRGAEPRWASAVRWWCRRRCRS